MPRRGEIENFAILFIVALILVADLFFRPGRPVTFDGPTHITNIAQFAAGLQTGGFPVAWADHFTALGSPVPIVTQQLTSYLGALFYFVTHDLIQSYNWVVFVGALSSSWLMYIFLREWAKPWAALMGAILFSLAPYRIINIYIRGALPEFFVSTWIILTALGLVWWKKGRQKESLLAIVFGVAGIFLTHPMMIIPTSILLAPLTIWAIWPLSTVLKRLNALLPLAFAALLGVGISGYYIFPLFLEVKYFYYGQSTSHFNEGQYLGVRNILQPMWHYFTMIDIGPRGQYFHLGAIEVLTILFAIVFLIWQFWQKKKLQMNSLLATVLMSFVFIFLMVPASDFLYRHVSFFNNVQHPWRMFTGFIFLPPFIFTLILSEIKIPTRFYILIGAICISLIGLARFPQLYGKNSLSYNNQYYWAPSVNLHGNNLNTIWSGNEKDYVDAVLPARIVEGEGKIELSEEKNGFRQFQVEAKTPLRIVNSLFYFPGWRVYADGQKTPIEFQDMNYRGLITYRVPEGTETVTLKFEDTAIRFVGKLVSGASLVVFVFWVTLGHKFLGRAMSFDKARPAKKR